MNKIDNYEIQAKNSKDFVENNNINPLFETITESSLIGNGDCEK